MSADGGIHLPGLPEVWLGEALAPWLAPTGTDVFYDHGYAALLFEGQWVKAVPPFNFGLCDASP